MSGSRMTTHHGEEQAMPKVVKVPLVEGCTGGVAPRSRIRQDHDERAYRRAYIEDHSREFRKALRTARVAFLVRMAVLA